MPGFKYWSYIIMKKKASLKDIARLVGVSTASVSYVLNNKEKESKVGKELAARIKAAAKKLNYQPNYIAKSLKSGSTKTIGLILEDISNPFFSNMARIIEEEAQLHGYTVVLGCHYENPEKSQSLLNLFLSRQVDGIIITPVDNSSKQIINLKKSGMPFVLVDRYFSEVSSNSVTINNYEISYHAVEHLIKRGYKRIGMIAFISDFEHMNDRIQGYQQALKDYKLPLHDKYLIKVKFNEGIDDIEAAIKKMLNQKLPIDSLFFANNVIGLKALNVIHDLKIKVPEELGIVSFDQRDAFDFFYAPLTYIKQNLKEIGQQSVRLLLKAIKEQPSKPTKIVVKAELVVRESSKG